MMMLTKGRENWYEGWDEEGKREKLKEKMVMLMIIFPLRCYHCSYVYHLVVLFVRILLFFYDVDDDVSY